MVNTIKKNKKKIIAEISLYFWNYQLQYFDRYFAFLSDSPDHPEWRRCLTEARGFCQQTWACESDPRETLPAAERLWLGHCIWNGWLWKICPGCWGCQTPQHYRRCVCLFVLRNVWFVGFFFLMNQLLICPLFFIHLILYVHMQNAFLVESTGCPLDSWKNQIYWLRSSHCASVWSKVWIHTISTDHQILWMKPRRDCVSWCCADIHGNSHLWQTWSSLIKKGNFLTFFSLSLSLLCSERCWFLTISGTAWCWRSLISTVGYFWPPETEALQTVSVVRV